MGHWKEIVLIIHWMLQTQMHKVCKSSSREDSWAGDPRKIVKSWGTGGLLAALESPVWGANTFL